MKYLPFLLPLILALVLRAAETPTPVVESDPIGAALGVVRNNLALVEGKEDLDPETKSQLLESYRTAESRYLAAKQYQEQEQVFRGSITTAPVETKKLKEDLAALGEIVSTNSVRNSLDPVLQVSELEDRLTKQRADLTALRSRLTVVGEQISQQKTRPDTLREQQGQIETVLSQIEAALNAESGDADVLQSSAAKRAVLIARRTARHAELAMVEQEQLSLPARAERVSAEREVLLKRVANAEVWEGVLDQVLIVKRREAAQQQRRDAEEAKRDARGKAELIKVLTDEHVKLTKEHAGLQIRVDETLKQERELLKDQASEVQLNFDRAKEQIELVGLSDSLAALLLDQWRRLPNMRTNRVALSGRKTQIGEAGLRRFQVEEELSEIPNAANAEQIKAWVREFYAEALDKSDEGLDWGEVAPLVDSRRAILTLLKGDYDRLLLGLGDLDFEESKHISLVEEYTGFLEERLLWIPSASYVRGETLNQVARTIRWCVSRERWVELAQAANSIPAQRPLFTGCLGLLLLVSVASRPLVRQKEKAYAIAVKRVSTDRVDISLKAGLLLLLQSAPFAAVLALLGRHLVEHEADSEFLRGLGVALLYASIHLFGLLVLLNVCRKDGLGQAHFRWDSGIAKMFRRQLFWFVPVVILMTMLVEFTEELSDEYHRSGLGRLGLVFLLLTISAFVRRTFRPADGLLSGVLNRTEGGWLVRMQKVWFWLLVLIPVGLAVLSLLGYHHTTVQLARRGGITISFLVGAFVVHQLIWRWFAGKERRLQLEQYLERRRVAAEAASEGGDQTSLPEINEDELDLKTLNEQTRRLLSSLISFSLLLGVWLIWSDVLPALNVLNAVKLWDVEAVVDGTTVTQAVTLNHLALALIIFVIVTIAVRNIGGVLEVGVLQNLPLAAGSRYAIVSVVQYAIVLFGAVFVFNVLGFSLAQFGWMVAALSVGLGFGLQEVVANFVSGVILLAERPIRVGDIVTVSDVSGIVTRIRIRATTITNWDRQELVVPNKEFITGRILNWTLSNTVNRIVITVGVAYGSKTERARELLLKIANEHPLIMNDPGPIATFEGFDDSTLRLLLRCYLPNLDNRLATVSDLHTKIDHAFAEAGIEIAFPQRDINIRVVPPELFKASELANHGQGLGPKM